MKRGEVWIGNLNPNRGAEVGKVRPVLIVQSDFLTDAGSETIVVLPMTTQLRPSREPLRVAIPARGRLRQTCHVAPEQPRTLDRQRLKDGPLTTLTQDEMTQVERVMRAVLGLP
ncbi:MAG: type II toxin-antitoxin system PemK/MazF family toxin [Betaproteobacteria bacterium]